ncbi:uncharacterized protein B0I36DRAFT_396406 [Microdochium trichocladiopsis]|uniref:BTB domain-containing protein n=1 Tax=Microdochium trichocladiopsis TaxID=1682393 RepID=A0A9P9BJR2_9PEZI|nr:uncharacterized protein B0I36DRAFT_396406 [Microdochium trichocladiopsis]KAH7016269.1 hypothetical protein B0I36DRAFT_396406 [Microdochium trichocladiopsis]
MLQVVMDVTSGGESKVSPARRAPPLLEERHQEFYLHRLELKTVPKLHSLVSANNEINMPGVSAAVGHVLVNFLYKAFYDVPALCEDGHDTKERDAEWLRCSFDVHATARQYGIDSLVTLAQNDIDSRAGRLEPSEALAAVKKACPLPDTKDEWLRNYTRTLLNVTYPSVEAFLTSTIMEPAHAEETMSITEMLLRTAWQDLKCEVHPKTLASAEYCSALRGATC